MEELINRTALKKCSTNRLLSEGPLIDRYWAWGSLRLYSLASNWNEAILCCQISIDLYVLTDSQARNRVDLHLLKLNSVARMCTWMKGYLTLVRLVLEWVLAGQSMMFWTWLVIHHIVQKDGELRIQNSFTYSIPTTLWIRNAASQG